MFRYYALYHLKTNRQFHIAIILLIVAPVLLIGASRQYNRYDWTPINVSLPLEHAVDLNIPFIANTPYPVVYFVQIDGERNLPFEKVEDGVTQICNGLNCQVTGDSETIIEEDYKGDSYGTTIAHTISAFKGVSGRRYRVHLSGKVVPEALRVLHSKLKVEVSPAYYEGPLIGAQLMSMFALLLGSLGLACLSVAAWSMIASYRQDIVTKCMS